MNDSFFIAILVIVVLFVISPFIEEIKTVLYNKLGYRLSEKELIEDKSSQERLCYNHMTIRPFKESPHCLNLCKIYKNELPKNK